MNHDRNFRRYTHGIILGSLGIKHVLNENVDCWRRSDVHSASCQDKQVCTELKDLGFESSCLFPADQKLPDRDCEEVVFRAGRTQPFKVSEWRVTFDFLRLTFEERRSSSSFHKGGCSVGE